MSQLLSHKSWTFFLFLFGISIPFGPVLPNILVIVLVLYWVLHFVYGKLKFTKSNFKTICYLSTFFIFYFIGLLYSENLNNFYDTIGFQMYLLLFPLIFFTIPYYLSAKDLTKIIIGFSLSTLLYCLLSLSNQIIYFGLNLDAITSSKLSYAIGSMHQLTLSLFVSLSMVFLMYVSCNKEQKKLVSILLHVAIAALCIFLLLLLSRTAIATTIIVLLIYAWKLKKARALYVIAGIVIVAFSFMTLNKEFQTKLAEVTSFNEQQNDFWGGTGIRLLIWDCASKVIANNPIIGVGAGDEMDELTLCYQIYMKNQLLVSGQQFHAHNMFLQSLVRSGVVGFALFLLALVYAINYALKRKNTLFLLFISVFLLLGLTESYFQLNIPVILFAFFNSCLLKTRYSFA